MAETHRLATRTALPDLEGAVTLEHRRLDEGGGSKTEVDRLNMLDHVLRSMREGLKPIPSRGVRNAGLVAPSTLDLSSPETLAASIKARVRSPMRIAAHTAKRRSPQAERGAGPDRGSSQGGDQLIGITSAIAEAAGDKAPAMLKQISNAAPTLAYIGGLAASAARRLPSTMRRTACYCAGHQASRRCAQGRAGAGRGPFRLGVLRAAATRDAAVATADAIYEVRARRAGVGDFDSNLIGASSMK